MLIWRLAGETISLTFVAGGVQNANTAESVETDQVTDASSILFGNCLLIFSIRVRDHMRHFGSVLEQKIFVVSKVWLVRVVGRSWLIGVGNERPVEISIRLGFK